MSPRTPPRWGRARGRWSPGFARSSWAGRRVSTGPRSSASSSSSASARSTRWDAARLAERKFFYVPSLSANTLIYKGMLGGPDRGDVPGRDGPPGGFRAGARAPALLDQHLPVVAPRPPVPDDRPQRRDQHAAREHQLDARAAICRSSVLGEDLKKHAGGGGGRQRLRRLRQRARVPRDGRAAVAAGGAHDDPGGLGGPRGHERGAQGLLRVPRLPHGAWDGPASIAFTDAP